MKLLFDENLSPRLPRSLRAEFPGSRHVRDMGFRGAGDDAIWAFARDHGFTIISKDSDFLRHATLDGPPPKAIWVRAGNQSTSDILILIRRHLEDIRHFDREPDEAILVLP